MSAGLLPIHIDTPKAQATGQGYNMEFTCPNCKRQIVVRYGKGEATHRVSCPNCAAAWVGDRNGF